MTDATTVTLPPAPAGVDAETWAKALAAVAAAAPAKSTGTGRKTAQAITELTVETAQTLVNEDKWAAQVRAGSLGVIYILPTVAEGGVYTLAQVKDGKVTHVAPAHVDRVRSPRHLPRALRLAGTWLGGQGAEEFANGPKAKATAKADEQPVAEAPAPEPTPEVKTEEPKAEKPASSKGGRKGSSKKSNK